MPDPLAEPPDRDREPPMPELLLPLVMVMLPALPPTDIPTDNIRLPEDPALDEEAPVLNNMSPLEPD
jgi:hypothetical protein